MIIWCDTETTGLNPVKDHLLEVALVVTDDDLVELASTSVVMQPVGVSIDSVQMDKVVVEMHTKNGLLTEIRAMEKGERQLIRRHEAEQQLIDFLRDAFRLVPPVAIEKCAHCGRGLKEHNFEIEMCVGGVDRPVPYCMADGYYNTQFHPKLVPAVSQTPLAGSTVSFDRSFLRQHMPKLESRVHYRSIDVSSLTELAARWAPEIYAARPKAEDGAAHRALPDILENIEYLRYFRRAGFVGSKL